MRLSIRLKFIIAVLLCLGIIMVIGLHRLTRLQQQSFEQAVQNRTELVSEFAKASQAYVNEQLRPATETKTDDFIIESMSSPYVTRNLFEEFNRVIPEYVYRQPTLNPLNPIDQADNFETEIIRQFQKNLDLKDLSGYRQQADSEKFYIAKPITVKASCLKCHGRPSQAPPEIIERYGQKQGYHWKVGEIVSALMIYVPTADLRANQAVVQRAIVSTFIVLGLGLVGTVFFLFEKLINRRIVSLSKAIKQRAHMPSNSVRLNDTTQDEVGMLSRQFNQMADRLDQVYQNLEDQITERTQTLQTLKSTQAQLVHAEKMSSLGKMVGGIAHEINNPAGFIYSNLPHTRHYATTLIDLVEQLSRQIPDDQLPAALKEKIEEADLPFITADFHQLISSMESGSGRIREIVVALRSFARLDESELKTVDLHEGIESALMLLQRRLEQNHITLSKSFGQLPAVTCFPGQLNQAIFHVLSNAIDASTQSTDASAQSKSCDPHIQIKTEQVDSAHCRICITDHGVGIAEDILPHIFDPFFTTKPVGDGTGLGLAISHQIVVETHGGELVCTSTPGEGTSMIMVIPTIPEAKDG